MSFTVGFDSLFKRVADTILVETFNEPAEQAEASGPE
jgi:hypothetical protein